MKNQEIFDTVVNHFKSQTFKSVEDDGKNCLYRGPEGLKCAVGVLIRDEEYNTRMEGETIKTVFNEGLLPKRLNRNLSLMGGLQFIHDDSDDILINEKTSSRLKELAKDKKLDSSKVDW